MWQNKYRLIYEYEGGYDGDDVKQSNNATIHFFVIQFYLQSVLVHQQIV
jgi:hypothetical protein